MLLLDSTTGTTTYLANDLVALQNGLESRNVWCEFSVNQDFVRPLDRFHVRLVALERYKSLVASEEPPCCPERGCTRDILLLQHDRSAVSEIEFGHVLNRLTKNLESHSVVQMMRLQIFDQVLEEIGTDIRKITCFSLDVFVSYEATSVDELEDMSVYVCKIDLLHLGRFRPATRRFCERMTQHYVASCNLGVPMDEVDSEPLVHAVLDKNLRKILQVRGRYLRSYLLAVNECIVSECQLAMNYR